MSRLASENPPESMLVLIVGLVIGCSAAPTQLVVVVHTDFAVPAELDSVRFEITGPAERVQTVEQSVGGLEDPAFPLTLGLTANDGALGPYRVEVIGRSAGNAVVRQVRRASMTAEAAVRIDMFLSRACAAEVCGDGQTCDRGRCTSIDVRPRPWDGQTDGGAMNVDAEVDDASRADAGAMDATRDGTDDNDAFIPDAPTGEDGAVMDAAPTDAAPIDTGPADMGPADMGPADTGPDSGEPDDGCSDLPAATTLFCDGFEHGLDPWNSTTEENGTLLLATRTAYRGRQALRARTTAPGARALAQARFAPVIRGDLWVRAYFRLGAGQTLNESGLIYLFEEFDPFQGVLAALRTTTPYFFVEPDTYQEGGTIIPGEWFCMELHVRIDEEGDVELFVNGRSVAQTRTASTMLSSPYRHVNVGIDPAGAAQTDPVVLHVDEVAIGTVRMPCDSIGGSSRTPEGSR